ncbi:MAG: hypothetical protein V1495_07455 [Pseudomonadota bacterium]
MMRGIGIALTAAAALYYGFLNFSPLDRYSREATNPLDYRKLDLERALTAADREMTIPEGGFEKLGEMRSERMWISLELARRRSGVGSWIWAVGLAGVTLFLISFARGPKRRSKRKGKDPSVPAIEVREAPAREVYVDDWEYQRQREGGFLSREEAVTWLVKDPLKKCDYCGAEMKPSAAGNQEGIELVTFYKKVPTGAKDLRVILGSYWFVRAASDLTCSGCERTVRR